MPGKLCNGGVTDASVTVRSSKAYCEGRLAGKAGLLIGDNPHTTGSDAAKAWLAGLASWSADPTGVPLDCCATAYGGGYIAP